MKTALITSLVSLCMLTLAFAYPPQHARAFVFSDHPRHGGWLGVSVQDVTKRLAEKKHLKTSAGAYVTDVVDDSPADRAGLQEGDVIVTFDDKKIDDSEDLVRDVSKAKPETEVKVDVVRGDGQKTFTAKLGESPRGSDYSFRLDEKDMFPRSFPHDLNVRIPRLPFSHADTHGLVAEDLTRQLAEYFEVPDKRGALVVEVKKGSDADKAGIKAGDVITKVDDSAIHDAADLVDELSDVGDSMAVKIEAIRKGKVMTLTMKIEDDDDSSSDLNIPDSRGSDSSTHRFIIPRANVDALGRLEERLKDLQRDVSKEVKEIQTDLSRALREL